MSDESVLPTAAKYVDKPRWWKLLLTGASKKPSVVLRDARCLDPDFCQAFFDVCDGKALEALDEEVGKTGSFASAALKLARKTGDPHLLNRAEGVVVHAHISREQWDEAEETLDGYEDRAKDCCSACRSDYYRRRADLLVETHQVGEAMDDLVRALDELGDELDEDTKARVRFLRGITHHYNNDRDQVLDDAAMLGDKRRAGDHLESVRKDLLASGPDRHTAAVSLDQMQLLARTPNETSLRALRRIVSVVRSKLKLEQKLMRRFNKLEELLFSTPEKAPAAIANLRRVVIAPVPGLV